MPELKVCGIGDETFAREAALRGVNFLGLIFAAGSPRLVSPAKAAEITAACAGLSARFVGVFVSHKAREIEEIARLVGLDVIQLHGDYADSDVLALKAAGFEVWRLRKNCDVLDGPEDAVLLDGRSGGESRLADWSLIAPFKRAGRRVVLAGAVSKENVASAIATGADIIDVNSSLEKALGVKSLRLLDELLDAVPKRSLALRPASLSRRSS